MKRIIYLLVFLPFLVQGQSLNQGPRMGSSHPSLIGWGGGDQIDYSLYSNLNPFDLRRNLGHSAFYEAGLNEGKIGILAGLGHSLISKNGDEERLLDIGLSRYFKVNDFVFSGGIIIGHSRRNVTTNVYAPQSSSLSLSGAIQYKKFVFSTTYRHLEYVLKDYGNAHYSTLKTFVGYEFSIGKVTMQSSINSALIQGFVRSHDLRLAARYKKIKAGLTVGGINELIFINTGVGGMMGFDTQRFTITANHYYSDGFRMSALNFCYRFGKYQDRVRWMI